MREDARAGAPLAVVLEPAQRTRTRLRVAAPIDELDVEVAHLEPSDGTAPAWPSLDRATPWSHAAHAAFASRGRLRSSGPQGTWRRTEHRRLPRVDTADGRTFELQLERGPAVLSVRGRSAGSNLSRLTTPPVTIAGDVVDVALPLTPTTACHGRVVFAAAARFPTCVALADDRGRLLAIRATDIDAQEQLAVTSSHGHFALRDVPVGTWELRVGTRAELESGTARLRRQVTIAAGANEAFVIEL